MSEEFVPLEEMGASESSVADLGQAGAEQGTFEHVTEGEQIAEPAGTQLPVPERTVVPHDDIFQDDRVRKWQSRKDQEIAALQRQLQTYEQRQTERERELAALQRQREEAEFNQQLNDQMKQQLQKVRTPAEQQAVKREFEAVRKIREAERAQQEFQYRQAMSQAESNRNQWADRAVQSGVPRELVAEAIAKGGNDYNQQIAWINDEAMRYLATQNSGAAAPSQPQARNQPVAASNESRPAAPQPAQPPQEAVRRTATPVSRPSGARPTAPSIASLRNSAMSENTPEAWARLKEAKDKALSQAKYRERYG